MNMTRGPLVAVSKINVFMIHDASKLVREFTADDLLAFPSLVGEKPVCRILKCLALAQASTQGGYLYSINSIYQNMH